MVKYNLEVEKRDFGHAQIRKYQRLGDGSYSKTFEVFARGLRNSIALAWDSQTHKLFQGENSRDAISKFSSKFSNAAMPNDEINVVDQGKHYGWPYCCGNNLNSPEWENILCSGYELPQMLLPAHSAPLGFLVYQGKLFPPYYHNRLFASLHGYEAGGHDLFAMMMKEMKKEFLNRDEV